MAHAFMIESSITATDVVANNRYCKSDADFDGGTLCALAAPTAQGDDVWTASVPVEGALGGLWVAYNPSYHVTEVGNGEYAGLSADIRDYTNEAGRTFTAFKPEIGNIFVISKDAVDSESATAAAGDILEAKAAQSTWNKVASATAGSTAVKIMHKVKIPFPAGKGKVGFDFAEGFKVEVIQ